MSASSESLRIMLYSHNTRGIGHAAKLLAIAWSIYHRMPQSSILYCGGGLHEMSSLLPPNTDYVKLPSFDAKKVDGKTRIVPARLNISIDQMLSIRREILGKVASTFQPHALLADFYPMGKEQELVDAIDWVKSHPRSRVYLGFRDIIDYPSWTAQFLSQYFDAIRKYVDRIFIYGDPTLFDFLQTYQLPVDLIARSTYSGYIVNRASAWQTVEYIRTQLEVRPGQLLIVASTGGGKDSADILLSIIHAQQSFIEQPELRWVIIAGPLAREEEWKSLEAATQGKEIKLVRYWPVLVELIHAADLFIGTCGYNLAAEVLATGVPAIFIPVPRKEAEQAIRAEILSQHGLGHVIPFQRDETEQKLVLYLKEWLAKPRRVGPAPWLDTNGADYVARCIEEDLTKRAI
jgi:predicted glycosyltransferase